MNSTTSLDRSPEAETYDRELSGFWRKPFCRCRTTTATSSCCAAWKSTTEETAECLNLSQENVKVRLHRAHAKLRRQLFATVGATATVVLPVSRSAVRPSRERRF